MERLFEQCNVYLNILENSTWLKEGDVKTAIVKTFKYANFIECLMKKLKASQTDAPFFSAYAISHVTRKTEVEPCLFEFACDPVLAMVWREHKELHNLMELANAEYIRICGMQRFNKFTKSLIIEEIASTLTLKIISDPQNYKEPAHQQQICTEISTDVLLRYVENCQLAGNQSWVAKLMANSSRASVESLLLIVAAGSTESTKLHILNSMLEQAVLENSDSNKFWKHFIRCDKELLLKIFHQHVWFFEECFEFIMRNANEMEKSDAMGGSEQWISKNWITFSQLVEWIKALWYAGGYLESYTKHSVTESQAPIWLEVISHMTV